MTPGPCLGTECPEAPLCAAREAALQEPERYEGYCHGCNRLGMPLDEQGFSCGVCCDSSYGPSEYEPMGGWKKHMEESERNLRIGIALDELRTQGKLTAEDISEIRKAVNSALEDEANTCPICGGSRSEPNHSHTSIGSDGERLTGWHRHGDHSDAHQRSLCASMFHGEDPCA